MTSENLSPPSVLPCSVQPRVETSWLALSLSARGLVDELSKYADENARIIVRLDDGADASAIGKEIARLLCAHPGELARVRRDTKTLLGNGMLAADGLAIRLSRIAHETTHSVDRPEAMTEAERSKRYRDNQKALRDEQLESSRNVTDQRDASRDDRHDASVTRPLSLKEDLNLKYLKEREAVTPIVTTKRDAAPAEISEARRATAKQLGLQDHRINLVWAGFVPKHAGKRKTEEEWNDRWAWWVTNQLLWDSGKSPTAPKSRANTPDVEPSWMREAMGET
jgi:hypothetical protein